MKEEPRTSTPSSDKTTPDELMESFQGKSLKSIIVFTLIVHAILLLGTSIPFLIEKVSGKNTSRMSEDERIQLAVKEATQSLRDIADEHGLNVQDISNQFAGGTRKSKTPVKNPAKTDEPTGEPEKPKSAIEKELDVKAKGPDVPPVEDDDLFK